MPTFNLGLIGTGYYARNHLAAWRQIERVSIAGLCDLDIDRARETARQFNIPAERVYSDCREMMARGDLDFVDIVTGPESHLSIVKTAAACGVDILCQKPFAPSVTEAAEMVRLAKQSGVRLMVTEIWRWLAPYRQIKELLDTETVGTIHAVRYAHKAWSTPCMAPGVPLHQPYFRTMPKLLFYEMGPHWFDLMRFLFGEPDTIYAEMRRASPHVMGEDTGVVTLRYKGFTGLLDMSWASLEECREPFTSETGSGFVERMTIDGDKGTLRLGATGKAQPGRLAFIDTNGNETVIDDAALLDPVESHTRLYRHFLHCLETGEPFETSGEQNLRTLEMISAAYRSSQTSQAVAL